MRQSVELRTAGVSIVAVLLSFGCGLWPENAAHLNVDAPLLAVVLALTLACTQRGADLTDRLVGLGVLPVVGVAAAEIGRLMIQHPNAGDTLFVLAVVLSIWLRRFGRRTAKAGTLVALPFVGILVTPVPLPPGHGATLWSAVVAVIAWFWVSVVQLAAYRTGFLPVRPDARAQVAAGPAAAARPTSSLRPPASTRMAIQMGLALGAAFVIGRYAFTPRWTWTVLTAFIVCSGNLGRGDVVHKSLLRITGAAAGTVAATLLAGVFGPRDARSVVLIFVVLAVGSWLRSLSYAYWAGCVTAVLSLLQGYFGETRTSLLLTRLEEILLGAAIGVLVSWVVLPVRTDQVVRRRIANALATLGELLRSVRRDPSRLSGIGARFDYDLQQLGQVAAPVRAHRLFLHRLPRHRLRRRSRFARRLDPDAPHLADAIDAVLRCGEPVRTLIQEAAIQEAAIQEDTVPGRAPGDRRITGLIGALKGEIDEARRVVGALRDSAREQPLTPTPEQGAESAHASVL
jgi:uncharacterized membrane protein YgaE (UPF0421/DUF939 family)